jgi:hypothetical protein
VAAQRHGGTIMDTVNVIFYVLVILGLVQIDRRLYDVVKTLRTMTTRQ